jgi:LysR family glycine cleavage system transcriptional activator
MDWLRLPPLNSLRAFSVVAETGSYTLAADRLNVTHAAVSQQVKALENRLGVALVTRNGRGIQLTNEGALLARDLDIGFATIGRGIERLSEGAENRPVQVTMSPAFAVEWLMPRIMEFQYDNPDITLMLNPTSEVVDLKPGGIDVAIRYRDRRRPPPNVKPVLISDMIVIGTPSLVGGQDLQDPASLTDLPWLQELGTNEAAEWFTYHGVVPDRPLTVNHMPGNLIMDAVRRGDGITYTARAFFRDDLEVGKVVELFSEPFFGVYFVETLPRPMRPAVRTFLDWLMSKAETVSA